jgi:hypothetical protein
VLTTGLPKAAEARLDLDSVEVRMEAAEAELIATLLELHIEVPLLGI